MSFLVPDRIFKFAKFEATWKFCSLVVLFFIIMIRFVTHQGAVSIRKTVLPGMAIPMLKIRRPNGRLIFNMEITILR